MRLNNRLRRNVPIPYQVGPNLNGYFHPYPQASYQPYMGMGLNPYPHAGQSLPFGHQTQPNQFTQHQPAPVPYPNQYNPNAYAISPFQQQQPMSPNQLLQNPLNPPQHHPNQLFQSQPNPVPYMNPYPKHGLLQKPKQSGSLLNSFKGQDGSIDLNKMVNTAGQMMHAVNQVSSMVKGLGSIFKV